MVMDTHNQHLPRPYVAGVPAAQDVLPSGKLRHPVLTAKTTIRTSKQGRRRILRRHLLLQRVRHILPMTITAIKQIRKSTPLVTVVRIQVATIRGIMAVALLIAAYPAKVLAHAIQVPVHILWVAVKLAVRRVIKNKVAVNLVSLSPLSVVSLISLYRSARQIQQKT